MKCMKKCVRASEASELKIRDFVALLWYFTHYLIPDLCALEQDYLFFDKAGQDYFFHIKWEQEYLFQK